MKAVCVIDMPKDLDITKTEAVADVYLLEKMENGELGCVFKRELNCKLKPLPEKNTWDITKNGHVTEYAEGYNACLDEITGETE